MVQLEEVADEDFFATQPGPKEDEDDWDTDDGTLGQSPFSASFHQILILHIVSFGDLRC
jgi:hypothetical protein